MNRFDIILRAGEILDDLVPELDIDERAIKYLKECMSRCAALDEAEKLKMPVIMIKDMNTGIVREYGTDIHDILTICEFDHVPYLAYENLQNGYGTVDDRDGYRFIADTYGYMGNKQVIAVNDEIYPSQKRIYRMPTRVPILLCSTLTVRGFRSRETSLWSRRLSCWLPSFGF